MPASILSLVPGELPSPYCFTDWQRLNVDIVARIQAILNTNIASRWNVGATTPAQEDRIFPWFNLNDGLPYWWNQQYGVWTAAPRVAGGASGLREIWTGPVDGSAAGLWRFDGGDGTDPTVVGNVGAVFGSFWTIDIAFAARFPIGAGTLPSATVIAVGATGGEETHQLTVPELPIHSVNTKIPRDGSAPDTLDGTALSNHDPTVTATWPSENVGGDQAHNNMPPYYGCVFIKRTSRAWLAVPG